MMIFFLNADEKVYARYGGRDSKSADSRQSLDGLAYTMKSVLEMHEREEKTFAQRTEGAPKSVRDLAGPRGFGRGCVHCHQVKETMQGQLRRSGKWDRDAIWRYPLPTNLGFDLEVDRGNVVRQVKEKAAAADVGLKVGDVLRRLNGVPVHSFADAQFGLDRAPKTGTVEVVWQRGEETKTEKLTLPEGWRKSDISWRP